MQFLKIESHREWVFRVACLLALLFLTGGAALFGQPLTASQSDTDPDTEPEPEPYFYQSQFTGKGHEAIEADIDALIMNRMVQWQVPGMTVAVTKQGRLVYNKGFGFANFANKTDMHFNHRTRLGSVSKVMTALAVMKLTEQLSNFDEDYPVYQAPGPLTDWAFQRAGFLGSARFRPVVDIAITGGKDTCVAWYVNGTVSKGHSDEMDYYSAPQPYTVPEGQSPETIRAIAIAKGSKKVYAWYDDGSRSAGTIYDLDAHFYYDDKPYTLPEGKSIKEIVGIGIAKSGDKVHTWYEDGTYSVGRTWDLGAHSEGEAEPFQVPTSKTAYMIRGMAISNNNRPFCWFGLTGYANKASKGDPGKPGNFESLFTYTLPHQVGAESWFTRIRVRHLLSHTAGFIKNGGEVSGAKALFDTETPDYSQINQFMLTARKFKFEPGTDESYSNHGAGLAGLIVTLLSGMPHYEYVQEEIMRPLGLEDRIIPFGTDINEEWDAAAGHTNTDDLIKTLPMFPVETPGNGTATGGYTASAEDLARLMVATDPINHLLVLLPETLNSMEVRQPNSNYGLGWKVTPKGSSAKVFKLGLMGGKDATSSGTAIMMKFLPGYTASTGAKLDNIHVAICININLDQGDDDDDNESDYEKLEPLAGSIAKIAGAAVMPVSYDLWEE